MNKPPIIATAIGIAFVTLLVAGLLRALDAVPFVGLSGAMADRGPIGSIAELLFTDYLFPFELTSALLITAATMLTVGFLNGNDERELAANQWAGHPVTMTVALLLFLAAAVLAYLADRPRLAEYKFKPS